MDLKQWTVEYKVWRISSDAYETETATVFATDSEINKFHDIIRRLVAPAGTQLNVFRSSYLPLG